MHTFVSKIHHRWSQLGEEVSQIADSCDIGKVYVDTGQDIFHKHLKEFCGICRVLWRSSLEQFLVKPAQIKIVSGQNVVEKLFKVETGCSELVKEITEFAERFQKSLEIGWLQVQIKSQTYLPVKAEPKVKSFPWYHRGKSWF